MLADHPIVICNAPLVSPIPLPYNSPTFLDFDLPDIDEDLSHPPYTYRQSPPSSRKRKACPELELALPDAKRRTSSAGTTAQHAQNRPLPQRRTKPSIPSQYHAAPLYLGSAVPHVARPSNYYYTAVP